MADVNLNEVLEFLQEHMVTKEDLKVSQESLKSEMREETEKIVRQAEHRILDHVDEKLVDMKGDIVSMMRKEDHKLTALVELLKSKNILDKNEADVILDMEPFPHISRS